MWFSRAACVMLAASTAGAATIIDFDAFDGMPFEPSPQAWVESKARIADDLLASHGIRFDSPGGYVAVVDLGVGHAPSGRRGIGGVTPGGLLTYNHQFMFGGSFFTPGEQQKPASTDFVSVTVDRWGEGQPVALLGFDQHERLVAIDLAIDLAGPTLRIDAEGIHRWLFRGSDAFGGTAIDDVAFGRLRAVPEPASFAAIALLAAIGRRRRAV